MVVVVAVSVMVEDVVVAVSVPHASIRST